MGQGNIRVLLAVDDFLAAQKLRDQCETLGFSVVGEAADGHEAVALTATLTPDVVLMDLELADMDGVTAAGKTQRCVPTPIILLAPEEFQGRLPRLCPPGVAAFLVAPYPEEELLETVSFVVDERSPNRVCSEELPAPEPSPQPGERRRRGFVLAPDESSAPRPEGTGPNLVARLWGVANKSDRLFVALARNIGKKTRLAPSEPQ
jgi:CheY-like chemotaxis protein